MLPVAWLEMSYLPSLCSAKGFSSWILTGLLLADTVPSTFCHIYLFCALVASFSSVHPKHSPEESHSILGFNPSRITEAPDPNIASTGTSAQRTPPMHRHAGKHQEDLPVVEQTDKCDCRHRRNNCVQKLRTVIMRSRFGCVTRGNGTQK